MSLSISSYQLGDKDFVKHYLKKMRQGEEMSLHDLASVAGVAGMDLAKGIFDFTLDQLEQNLDKLGRPIVLVKPIQPKQQGSWSSVPVGEVRKFILMKYDQWLENPSFLVNAVASQYIRVGTFCCYMCAQHEEWLVAPFKYQQKMMPRLLLPFDSLAHVKDQYIQAISAMVGHAWSLVGGVCVNCHTSCGICGHSVSASSPAKEIIYRKMYGQCVECFGPLITDVVPPGLRSIIKKPDRSNTMLRLRGLGGAV